jgi:hypothetical protein
LIQKYFEALASAAELAELEELLKSNPEVAAAFADAARLDAGLSRYFQRQYKIDQVSALLQEAESEPSSTVGPAQPGPAESRPSAGPSGGPAPGRSTFVPVYLHQAETLRRRRSAMLRTAKRIAVLLLVVTGVTMWLFRTHGTGPARLVSGQVQVAGREVAAIPLDQIFEVTGPEQAVIDLPGGGQMKLTQATRAIIERRPDRTVVILKSGGGQFNVSPGQLPARIETEIGAATVASGRFSIDLMTVRAIPASTTTAVPLPNLTIAVAEGSVTFEQSGKVTVLSRGDAQVFFKAA